MSPVLRVGVFRLDGFPRVSGDEPSEDACGDT